MDWRLQFSKENAHTPDYLYVGPEIQKRLTKSAQETIALIEEKREEQS